ncbi:MocR-like pyridoxine biosynthesis transcription factor PdxR [Lactiplantibacillus plajomi]|uniref:PLP-dependent aminotransferase family protein n=1 Tax=Lactiplantibacillus plajomi TaxID=1457217 RepID=A0ABV6K4W4_9LACO|nr:PLP-dependent aminotransferase family protein [Lactiplantibacillus plajomi]
MRLDRNAPTPLYLQLYQQLRDDYAPQRAAQRLWSIRKMAQNLGVSKTTVEQAYEQLRAEGYVYTVPGSGYYYQDLQHWPAEIAPRQALPAFQPPATCRFDFRYGTTERLPASWNAWKKAVREALRRAERTPDYYPNAQGLRALRDRLADFLKTTRGVSCDPEQIVITTDAKAGLSTLLSILPAGTVGLENPGYRGLSQLATSFGHRPVQLPVTTTGVDLAAVVRQAPDVVYTTPAHQFPLGYTQPVGQRLELLKWAAEQHKLIVEDDYDSEYRYNVHPLPALQLLATADQVAYLGTFSRGIDATLRMGYLVLPLHLVARYHQHYRYREAQVAGLLQQAMLTYFENGAYYRHLSRSRAVNRQKYQRVSQLLATTPAITPITTGAGLHLVVRIKGIEQAELLAALTKVDMRIYPLDSNWQAMPSHDYYLLGIAGLPLATLTAGVQRLIQVCEQLLAH